MKFENRPPINLEAAELVATARRDGGVYDGVGYDLYAVYRGGRFHLIHTFSDNCDWGSGISRTKTHLGSWLTVPELAAYLKSQRVENGKFPWWCSELLESLDIAPETA